VVDALNRYGAGGILILVAVKGLDVDYKQAINAPSRKHCMLNRAIAPPIEIYFCLRIFDYFVSSIQRPQYSLHIFWLIYYHLATGICESASTLGELGVNTCHNLVP